MSKIELRNIGYCYREKGNKFQALENITLTVEEGEFICIIGRSGCGKSTLLRIISGLMRPSDGELLINGEYLTEPSTKTAMVFQNYTLFPWMKVLENVVFGIRQSDKNIDRKEAKKLALDMLEKVEMLDARDKYPYQLSGGMQQRVALARALAMKSDILLLDEPFGALDARTRRRLRKLLEKLWMASEKRKTVIMVTHDVGEAVKLGDRIVFMIPGRIKEIIDSNLPRPRCRMDTRYTCDLENLKKRVTQLFYQTGIQMEEKEHVSDEI